MFVRTPVQGRTPVLYTYGCDNFLEKHEERRTKLFVGCHTSLAAQQLGSSSCTGAFLIARSRHAGCKGQISPTDKGHRCDVGFKQKGMGIHHATRNLVSHFGVLNMIVLVEL
jgi:hypothetical protein